MRHVDKLEVFILVLYAWISVGILGIVLGIVIGLKLAGG